MFQEETQRPTQHLLVVARQLALRYEHLKGLS